jgi:hypothetical protein
MAFAASDDYRIGEVSAISHYANEWQSGQFFPAQGNGGGSAEAQERR